MAAKFDFYGLSENDTKSALKEMGCQLHVQLNDGVKAHLLRSDEKRPSESPTDEECLKSIQATKFKLYNDPIHGSIELHPLLAKIVDMPAFTRLKNIRQLGGVYYVYPGATHTRFEHSIGTCYIAGEFIRMLRRKQPELHISEKEALCVEIAALCHDLGHGPFSHLFEKDVVKKVKKELELKKKSEEEKLIESDPSYMYYPILDFPKHEELSAMVFENYVYLKEKSLFNSYGMGQKEVVIIKQLIDHDFSKKLKKTPRRFLYEIVANKCTGIDVDKWDYFARDCHYMGILTEFDWRRLMALSRVIKVDEEYRICYRDKEVNNIYGMFRTRCTLHQKAYQHQAVIGAEHMIAQAILNVKDILLILPWSTNERTHSERMSIMEALKGVTESPPKLEGYLALNDSIVHLILHGEVKIQEVDSKCNEDERKRSQEKFLEAQTLLHQLDERMKFTLVETDTKENISKTVTAIIAECDDSNKPTPEDIYVRPVKISYASEEKDDPVEDTFFYTKDKPWIAIKGDDPKIRNKRSDLINPKKLVLEETRLYISPSKFKQVETAYLEVKAKKREEVAGSTQPESSRTCTPDKTDLSSPKHRREETPSKSFTTETKAKKNLGPALSREEKSCEKKSKN